MRKIKQVEETIIYISSKIFQLEKARDADNISLCERGCITREIDYQKSLLDSLTQALNVLNDIYKQCQQTEDKEVKSMNKELTRKDIDDGKRIAEIFTTLSEENKTMAIVYISALRDKEVADSNKLLVNT